MNQIVQKQQKKAEDMSKRNYKCHQSSSNYLIRLKQNQNLKLVKDKLINEKGLKP